MSSSSRPPLYEFGGSGPVIHLAVANGFPPQTYRPLMDTFTRTHRVLSLPPRPLWPDETPPDHLVNWRDSVAQDLLAGLHVYDLRDAVAIGHSFGGVATMIAAISEPERFRAVILLDPTILPHWAMCSIRAARFLRYDRAEFLARRAEKRRFHFASHDEAFAYFRPKTLFADWSDEALRGYVETMSSDESGVTLAWSREWEAYIFRTLYTGSWRDLPHLRDKMPLLLVRGETSNTLFPRAANHIRRILPEMDYAEIPGHGHLFPQSAPEATYRILHDWLARL